MGHTWIYILSATLALAACKAAESDSVPENEEVTKEEKPLTLESLENFTEEQEELPILPPIILLDFANDTNASSDEKSKRTINGNLGYGFQRNDLFSGKTNYYFPAGKSGTTVSIEESISPFLPKTIIETIKPITEKPYSSGFGNVYSGTLQQNVFSGASSSSSQQQGAPRFQYPNAQPLVFGQRTKLQKTTAADYATASRYPSTPKPIYEGYSTPRPSYQVNPYSSGLNFDGYSTPRPDFQGYSTPRPADYSFNSAANSFNGYTAGYNGGSTTASPRYQESSTPKPTSLPSINSGYSTSSTVLSPLGNTPKYSYENGIKYEHKIVWKYPDGKVSEVAPNSYMNSYSEYSAPAKSSPTNNYLNPSYSSNYQRTPQVGYSGNLGNIYSQSPATFPTESNSNEQTTPNQFVSSASLSSGEYGSAAEGNQKSQNLGYQSQFASSNSQQANAQTYSSATLPPSTNYKSPSYQQSKQTYNPASFKDEIVPSPYPVDSPEAEYRNPTSPSPNLYTTSGQVAPNILSKYTPQVQDYLMKALGAGTNTRAQGYNNVNPGSYSNLQYSNLLNYNPSISQYIRDPSSILNARPTFIQAGNSLIPVIILRVDGVAPVQPKVTPNVNLKALLQQYLTQYAQSVNDLAQAQNFGSTYRTSGASGTAQHSQTPLFDLNQLTQSLKTLPRNPNFGQNFAQSFAQNVAQRSESYDPSSFPTQAEYNSLQKSDNVESGSKYVAPTQRALKQKVKNVQIIDDPRFTTYNTKS